MRSQSTAEIKLLPTSESGWPPYWNSISGFDFDLIFLVSVSFCIDLPNFVKIELPSAELWRHFYFYGQNLTNQNQRSSIYLGVGPRPQISPIYYQTVRASSQTSHATSISDTQSFSGGAVSELHTSTKTYRGNFSCFTADYGSILCLVGISKTV